MRPIWMTPLLLLLPAPAIAQVPGSYQRTCTNVSQNGSMLSARCRGSNGQFNDTTLDTDRCGRNLIVNSFGRLLCGDVYGTASPVTGDDDFAGRRRRRYDQGQDDGGGYVRRRHYDPDADNGPPPGFGNPPPRHPHYSPYPPDDAQGFPPPPRRRFDPYNGGQDSDE